LKKKSGVDLSNLSGDSFESTSEMFLDKKRFIEHMIQVGVFPFVTHDVIKSIVNLMINIVKADACLLYIYHSEIEKLELITSHRIPASCINYSNETSKNWLCRWIYENQEEILINDIKNDNIFNKNIKLEFEINTCNLYAFPLLIGKKCIGVIELVRLTPKNIFTLQDASLVKTISHDITILLANELLFNKCGYQLYQRSTMLDLAREINTSRELSDLLHFLVVKAAELLNAEASSLLLRKEDVLQFEIAFGEKGTEIKKFTVPLGVGIAGKVAVSGESMIINKAEAVNSGIFKKIDKKTGFIPRNLIAVPLKVKDQIIGVIEVVNQRSSDGFSSDDISLLEGYANEAALAIERAQLLEKKIRDERLATIGRTVAGIAHCIKNITNATKGGEYIVDKGLRDKNLEILKKGWHITKQGGQRIRDLVLDMLTISKRRQPNYILCDPTEIVIELVDLLKLKAEEKKVKIKTKFDNEIGTVKIDRENIFRCLMNLVSNAIDACHENDGLINLEIFKLKDKPFFGFSVTDNGVGISEKNQKKLFQEFFSTKGSQGTGLGLSVTYAIVNEHDGNIKCVSKPGEGTTFKIELPININ
jgi:signal transduction histidine kinase